MRPLSILKILQLQFPGLRIFEDDCTAFLKFSGDLRRVKYSILIEIEQNLDVHFIVEAKTRYDVTGEDVGEYVLALRRLLPGSHLNIYLKAPSIIGGKINFEEDHFFNMQTPECFARALSIEVKDLILLFASIVRMANASFRSANDNKKGNNHQRILMAKRFASLALCGRSPDYLLH